LSKFASFVLCLAAVLFAVIASAQEPIPANADEADIFDNFGASIDVDGNRMLVGPVRGRNGGGAEIFLFIRDASGQWSREASFPSGWQQFPVLGIPGYLGGRANWRLLSLHDPWLVIGNPHKAVGGLGDVGEVRIYRRGVEGWAEHSVIAAPTVVLDGGFGNSTAFDGTWLAVGHPGVNKTHIYRLEGTTFNFQQTLQPSNQVTVGFGSEVEFTGNQLFVRVVGELHVHTLNAGTWSFSQLLTSATTGLGSTSVFALDGDLLGVVAGTQLRLFRRTSGTWAAEAGATLVAPAQLRGFAIRDGAEIHVAGYTFSGPGIETLYWRRSGGAWSSPTPLPYPSEHVPSATRSGSSFASFSFAFDANRLYLGARFTTFNRVVSQGSAYTFRMATGVPVFERTFRHGNGWLGDNLGKWIANDGDWMAASAHGTDVVSGASILRDVGVVHLHRRTDEGWSRVQTLAAPEGQAFDTFGEVVSMRGDLVIVGSLANYQGINDHGRVHVYRRGPANEWALLCELMSPIPPVAGSMAWRTDDGLQEFTPIQPAVSDGEHVVAIYRNRAYAWRTTASACLAPVEILVPDRGAVPGAPGTVVPSNLELNGSGVGGMAPGRLLLAESGGQVDAGGGSTTPTASRTMIYDFLAGQWVRSHLYTSQSGDACGTVFTGSFTSPTTLRRLCFAQPGNYSIVTWTENAGSWTSNVVSLPALDAGETASGFAGNSVVTYVQTTLPNGTGTQFRVREPPTYALSETLSMSPACLPGHTSDFPRHAPNDIFMPCRQADGPNGRRSGEIRVFSRNLSPRGTAAFDPQGQLLLPPPSFEIARDGFENVPP